MRAAASNVCVRARNRQSHRVTRRSFILTLAPRPLELPGTDFHPVPSHSGQTSTDTLISWDLITWDASTFFKISSPSTLHPKPAFVQAANLVLLCTSCEPTASPVEDVGKPSRWPSKVARVAPIRAGQVRNRLPARIFPVDIRPRGRRIQNGQVSQLSQKRRMPRFSAGHERDLRGETMNKADLVDKIAGACEISKAQATTAIDTAVESITGALRKGDRVALIGFGTFSVSQRKARNGRNPQTGATIKIAARRVAKFSPGAELKKSVNKK